MLNPQGRPPAHPSDREREPLGIVKAFSLSPFYTLGGPSTHFGGSGADPWTESGGHKRARLKATGVTEKEWIFRTAESTREAEKYLLDLRKDAIAPLRGDDLKGWVWTVERKEDSVGKLVNSGLLGHPPKRPMSGEAKRSALAQEATVEDGDVEMNGSQDKHNDMGLDEQEMSGRGQIVVQSAEEEEMEAAKHHWGLGEWRPGVVQAAFEVRFWSYPLEHF